MPIDNRGFTLVETVLFIVIVSVAVAAISLQFSQNVQHSAQPLLRQKAIAYAHQYLDQMQTVRWDENTPIVGGTTTTLTDPPGTEVDENCTLADLDDFDDFNCFSDEPLGGGFTFSIDVTNGASAWDAVPAARHKRADIRISMPGDETLELTLYRADY
ncbi:type IV pilus modification PilV family protein [Thiohalomonas denitrificans]|uniref:MSHA pilin protein MshD n=1 Tax=Thiohalomonas denitrificans TaxID=415747 RepID=A0A1G5QV70_9GAMM|nr:type II secretion system protein [Thiohalomonas denitrificans]SCZ65171.1 MSHA pilin protein MshD [Thiohalomonas denitrificans]